ncbi:hypothetical protein Daus18300_014285 [Diaporthe australafricana]|uniref:Uncharacterized protein n=1 Tax=Diaporthe australafricana TaxID=127596 RepID=A0ABR3VVY9_9PEZI
MTAPETQMTAPEPDPQSEQPKPEIKYTPKLEPNPSHKIHQTSPHNGEKTGSSPTTLEALGYATIHTFCDDVFSFLGEEICKRILETYHARQAVRKAHKEPAPVIHQGTFAQIDQQHNQLRRFTQKQRQDHKKALCLEWVNDPDEPEAAPAFGESQLPLRPTHGAARVPQAEIVREQRRLNSARRQHKTDKRGRIAPPPVNTPQRIIAPRVVSRPVRDEYTLTARHHLLSAGQRSALHKRGHGSAKRLCVVSRRQNRRTAWAC